MNDDQSVQHNKPLVHNNSDRNKTVSAKTRSKTVTSKTETLESKIIIVYIPQV